MGIIFPPEDASQPEHLSDEERYKSSREKPYGIETTRGIIEYHNEIVNYDQEIYPQPDNNEDEVKKTIFYKLIKTLLVNNPTRILDLGCGGGQFLRELKELFGDKIETHGITARAYDRDGKPIMEEVKEEAYLERERKNGINMEVKNMSDLEHFSDGSFDIVVSAEGINYAGDPLKVVRQTSRILKDGGLMLAGSVAVSIEGLPLQLAGNTILNPRLGFQDINLANEVQNIPIKRDVICFTKRGNFSNPQLQFSHSTKFKNGAVYKRVT